MTRDELNNALSEWEGDCYLQQEHGTATERRIADGLLSAILQEQTTLNLMCDTVIAEDNGVDIEFLNGFMQDPIIERDDGWFFYDETWGNLIGPFKNRGAAVFGLKQYVRGLG
jgi:hypothetical protein